MSGLMPAPGKAPLDLAIFARLAESDLQYGPLYDAVIASGFHGDRQSLYLHLRDRLGELAGAGLIGRDDARGWFVTPAGLKVLAAAPMPTAIVVQKAIEKARRSS